VFIVIDGSSSEIADAPIRDGMAFSIDCVSSFLHYHGDFARTIFVGEPHPLMRRGTTAIHTAWQDIRSQLRAGMRFADVQRIGRESMKRQGADFTVSFTPHSVGLHHTDHPRPSIAEGRNIGLFGMMDVRKNSKGEPLAPYNGSHPAMNALAKFFKDEGLFTFVRWSSFTCNPPLCITEAQLLEGFAIIDRGLDLTDAVFEG
jgi:hypothetical protein